MTVHRYRILLWIYIALKLVTAVSGLFPFASQALLTAYDDEPKTWLMSNLWVAGALLSGLCIPWLVGIVGLLRFKSWARPVSLYSTCAGFLVYPWLGTSLYSGLTSTLYEASAVLWGAILALSYFSAVSARFER